MVKIKRHKTAIVRNTFSRPLQLAYEDKLFHKPHRKMLDYFDYGCGKGNDVVLLNKAGFKASGWDLYYSTRKKLEKAFVVGLNYVLCTIEHKAERVRALKEAFSLAKYVLVVSVRTRAGKWKNPTEYKDGIITSIGTFQKIYTQNEIKEFIEKTLKVEAIPRANGVFYVYKEE